MHGAGCIYDCFSRMVQCRDSPLWMVVQCLSPQVDSSIRDVKTHIEMLNYIDSAFPETLMDSVDEP